MSRRIIIANDNMQHGCLMSQLGHKTTFRCRPRISALPSKADIPSL